MVLGVASWAVWVLVDAVLALVDDLEPVEADPVPGEGFEALGNHFLSWSPGPSQEPGVLELEETEDVEAGVDGGVVVVVGLDEPVVSGGATREVNLKLSREGWVRDVSVAADVLKGSIRIDANVLDADGAVIFQAIVGLDAASPRRLEKGRQSLSLIPFSGVSFDIKIWDSWRLGRAGGSASGGCCDSSSASILGSGV